MKEEQSVPHLEIVVDHHYGGLNPMQFGWQNCAPSHSFGPAVRTHWLLHYVVSGFGSFLREEVTYRVSPGQIFVIPPFLETYYEADARKPWHYIWIGFTTEERLPEVLAQPVITCPEAGAVFAGMRSCTRMENGRSAFLSGCLWRLLSILLEQTPPKADYIEKALSCMHSEYAREITIQDIADRLGLDRSYFSALFSQRMGTSPSEYLINLRLSKAAELMAVYGERPATAALSVGYHDLYHFSRIFKKYFGMPPRSYWKEQQAKNAWSGNGPGSEAR